MLTVTESISLDFSCFTCTRLCAYLDLCTFLTREVSHIHHHSVDIEQYCHQKDPLCCFIITTLTFLLPYLLPPYLTPGNHYCVSRTLSFKKFYINEIIGYVNFRGWLFFISIIPWGVIPIVASTSSLFLFIAEFIDFFALWLWTSHLLVCTFLPEGPWKWS